MLKSVFWERYRKMISVNMKVFLRQAKRKHGKHKLPRDKTCRLKGTGYTVVDFKKPFSD